MTTGQATMDETATGASEPIMCPLCPDHDPFADATALQNHNNRMLVEARKGKGNHVGVTDLDAQGDSRELDQAAAADDPEPFLEDEDTDEGPKQTVAPELADLDLSRVDMFGAAQAGSILDVSAKAVLDRQLAGGLPYDPITLMRIVKLGGEVRVRDTVGPDIEKGRQERKDYWHPTYGWVRDGYIVERGRVVFTPDGKPLVV